jgi:hypothetical protein
LTSNLDTCTGCQVDRPAMAEHQPPSTSSLVVARAAP